MDELSSRKMDSGAISPEKGMLCLLRKLSPETATAAGLCPEFEPKIAAWLAN
jgi:hypothetical protein